MSLPIIQIHLLFLYCFTMLSSLAAKIFGTANERFIKTLHPVVEKINGLEASVQNLSDEELAGRTGWFRERLNGGETLDDLLPEAFATVREASRRVLGMRHFDVQLIGGMVLHKGMIAEMRTGEGKTLVSTLAAYLNALPGTGVHVVTVNDYLAKRDSEWMGHLHSFLGLTVGCITHGLDDSERKAQYGCDITYATNNELGFDYLRDNMKYSRDDMAHRAFSYAVVDEVDSILIDEARTPLIISGPTEDNSELYVTINAYIPKLEEGDYEKDEKQKSVTLTEAGVAHMETLLVGAKLLAEDTSLYDIDNVSLVHHVNQALRAHKLFTADVDYIVKDGKVMIIDEFTGRMMEGRRYSEGLHQALEAKEGVEIQNENQTLASITFQNYFRLYPKLSGMTGTAMTEAGEFHDIYKLNVVEIPTNVNVKRADHDDEIYRTASNKYDAVITLIEECHARQQPVLVGTISIEKSEYLSDLLKKRKIPHQVLNARHHEQEAQIIAQAGRQGAVTIATNMAGRGTDIVLGGNAEMLLASPSPRLRGDTGGNLNQASTSHTESSPPSPPASEGEEEKLRGDIAKAKEQVLESGGLFVIATERHESRRIDNQLRGRSGRQGDPGASKFFISFEDDLTRIFGGDRLHAILPKLGLKDDEALIHPMLSRQIERAQQKVEQRNYEIRKNLLKFDDVMNDQRKVIYEQRLELMDAEDIAETIVDMREEVLENLVKKHIPAKSFAEQWDAEGLEREMFRIFGLHVSTGAWAQEEGIADEEILARLKERVDAHVQAKEEQYGHEMMRMGEKRVVLQTLDQLWKDHLHTLDHLRQGINLRAYGQRDPLNEYKSEAFNLFEHMLNSLRETVTQRLAHLEIHVQTPDGFAPLQPPQGFEDSGFETEDSAPAAQGQKVGRNDPCPCGSGKKFKHCHGAIG